MTALGLMPRLNLWNSVKSSTQSFKGELFQVDCRTLIRHLVVSSMGFFAQRS